MAPLSESLKNEQKNEGMCAQKLGFRNYDKKEVFPENISISSHIKNEQNIGHEKSKPAKTSKDMSNSHSHAEFSTSVPFTSHNHEGLNDNK